MLGYVIIGGATGLTALAAGLVFGAPLWLALLAYPLVGSTTLLVAPLVRAGRDTVPLPHRVVMTPVTSTALLTGQASLDHAAASASMRILAVDDDPFVLEIVQSIAATSGFPDVVTARSGQEALSILAASDRPFDCLLFDISMPRMDGSDLCCLVRGMPAYHHTPIIMLTAKRDTKNMARAFRAGATDYATKPFDIVAFGARLLEVQLQREGREGAGIAMHRAPGQAAGASVRVASGPPLNTEFEPGARLTGLVSHAALTNYVNELATAALVMTRVVAVRIDGVASITDGASSAVSVRLHRTIATAAADVFGPTLALMAFADNRTLLIVTDQAMQVCVDLEDRLQRSIQSLIAQDTVGRTSDIRVSVGEPVQPREKRGARARGAFDQAVRLADHRTWVRQNATGDQLGSSGRVAG